MPGESLSSTIHPEGQELPYTGPEVAMSSLTMSTGLSTYSCGACRVKFSEQAHFQAHFKSDWHRYNLKRKVAELPPISVESFGEILKTYQAEGNKAGDASDSAVDKLYCKVCAKSFLNEGSHNSHLESKKHLERAKVFVEGVVGDGETEDTDKTQKGALSISPSKDVLMDGAEASASNEDDWEDEDFEVPPYDVTLCLFCPKKSASFEDSLTHMVEHTFFIPDFEYCADPSGLVNYLGQKITDGHMCLYCNQQFQDTTATHRHMDSKGHRKMRYEGDTLLEYEDFYDFSAADEGEEGKEAKEDLDGTGYEMTLPSGATIGHRDLNRYYKQKLRPVKDVALVSRVSRHYKALGWKSDEQGMGYARDMLNKLNKLKKEQFSKNLRIGMQNNKINMKHYRRQYGF
ncbi:hypothetical protein RvY_16116 [Ramazzottius varieornatus]|uniref:C2H2-type domain-containing protein n=1 Tax=Ramazzottius varieornatus TaxID=947166 RepID=A0A1D1VYB7_RAMVA|nr:hypothetical protein RvY_16116 [Ramazzottius varieornatus]